MEKSYFETVDLFNEAIDFFGWAAVTAQFDINEAADRLGKSVVSTYKQLKEEERKDGLAVRAVHGRMMSASDVGFNRDERTSGTSLSDRQDSQGGARWQR